MRNIDYPKTLKYFVEIFGLENVSERLEVDKRTVKKAVENSKVGQFLKHRIQVYGLSNAYRRASLDDTDYKALLIKAIPPSAEIVPLLQALDEYRQEILDGKHITYIRNYFYSFLTDSCSMANCRLSIATDGVDVIFAVNGQKEVIYSAPDLENRRYIEFNVFDIGTEFKQIIANRVVLKSTCSQDDRGYPDNITYPGVYINDEESNNLAQFINQHLSADEYRQLKKNEKVFPL